VLQQSPIAFLYPFDCADVGDADVFQFVAPGSPPHEVEEGGGGGGGEGGGDEGGVDAEGVAHAVAVTLLDVIFARSLSYSPLQSDDKEKGGPLKPIIPELEVHFLLVCLPAEHHGSIADH